MKLKAVYAGTFDPITLGHVDLIDRAARIFDRLIVAVASSSKKKPLFALKERVELVSKVVESNPKVEVDSFDGLLVEYVHSQGIQVMVRGLRAFSDFEFEFQMALTNRQLAPDIETLFLMPKEDHSYLSSSTVREIAELGGDTRKFVPDLVHVALKKKLKRLGRKPGLR